MILKREPVAFQALVLTVLNLVAAFGLVDLTPAQIGAVNALTAAVLGFVTRQQVTPVGARAGAQEARA